MRLIDADALYKSFGASGNCNNCPLDAYKCQYYNEHTLMEFCERIDDAPTVDAVSVVRCKDCRWGKEACGNIECFADLNAPTEYHGYEWYCPNGERGFEDEID